MYVWQFAIMRSSWISHSLDRFAMQSHCQIFVKRTEWERKQCQQKKNLQRDYDDQFNLKHVISSVDVEQQSFTMKQQKDRENKSSNHSTVFASKRAKTHCDVSLDGLE